MTEGERFVGSLPTKTNFHDRSKRRSYELTRTVAKHIIDDPTLIRNGQSYLERLMRGDPRQSRYYSLWNDLLRKDVRLVVRRMLEDTPEGDLLRDTQPVFVVLSPDERIGMAAKRDCEKMTEHHGAAFAP
jgi:hypothetical protein